MRWSRGLHQGFYHRHCYHVSEPSFVYREHPRLSISSKKFWAGYGTIVLNVSILLEEITPRNMFDPLKPIQLNLMSGGFGGSSYQRFARPILLRKDDHYIPTPTAVGLANPQSIFKTAN